ncbi:chemotaxis protein CheY [Stutzerimonas stutzeri]|uniref:histidine kinase n=1 Tax=Stutzerimonas stutzeri TaxID=316 RepID=W8R7Z6_STUST|nr:ATP-binding protein [Stutzerimonas stutzeri]AHL74467.1 chemotaxis protein CheY [Stutzerimonas stutzeri]MCQ4328994.1 response regulator [Stutzerimonas stutzeri]
MADLQRIFDALPGIVLVVANDADYTMVAASQERLRATMTRREEIIGRPLFEVYHDGDTSVPMSAGINLLRTSLAEVARTGRVQHLKTVGYPLRRPHAEGGGDENRYWDVVNVPVLDEQGQVSYIIHQAEDVTESLLEQESAALRLRESDERLNAALLASGTGTFYWDLRNNRLDMDLPMQRLFGLEGLTSGWLDDLLDMIHPDDRNSIAQQCERCARYGDDFEMQFRVRLPEGNERWIFDKGQTFTDANGRPSYMVGACLDITQHKRTEQALHRLNETLEQRVNAEVAARARTEAALRQSQKMEAVGQLTGGLAHDFNNLLAGVIGSLELLSIRLDQGRTDDLLRYIRSALTSATRATALTHRLLAFSRRQTLDPSPTDLNTLIEGMMELLQRTIGPMVSYSTHLSDGLWLTLCDTNQLENALLNLTINARDAMPDGGQLTLVSENLRLDEPLAQEIGLQSGEYVALGVRDTGVGIPPEKLGYVFDPFYTTKPLGEGTGLGLSMVYGFAKQSGGGVRIESTVGEGTSVWIYLPRHHGQSASLHAPSTTDLAPASVEGRTVLVVDDEPNVRMLVTEVLQEMGLNTLEAAEGPSGLRILDSDAHLDLLISDIGLPGGMNGRQLADAAREKRPSLRVLFITGYAESSVLQRSNATYDYEVLTKPFSISNLEDKVRSMLEPGQEPDDA